MSRHFDLDALRAARAEALGEPPSVTLAGETFALPVEMPWAVVEALATDTAEGFRAAVVALLGDDQYRRVCELGVSRDDLGALVVMAATELYEAGNPEASGASQRSSPDTSRRSKPTSTATTGSTSAKPSSGPTRSGSGGSAT